MVANSSISPNVQPDKRYEVSLIWAGAHPPELTPKPGRWRRGVVYRERHGIAAARRAAPPISAVNVDEVNIDFFRVDAEYLPRFLAEYRPGAGMGNWGA